MKSPLGSKSILDKSILWLATLDAENEGTILRVDEEANIKIGDNLDQLYQLMDI